MYYGYNYKTSELSKETIDCIYQEVEHFVTDVKASRKAGHVINNMYTVDKTRFGVLDIESLKLLTKEQQDELFQ